MTGAGSSGCSIGPISIEVAAPAPLVFQMLCAIGQGQQHPGEAAEIIERNGDEMVCEFTTVVTPPLVPPQAVRTREWVRTIPPDRVEYRHLDGPVRGLEETITVEPIDQARSRLEYRAAYPTSGLLGRLRYHLARPMIEQVMREHFRDLKDRAEERARRSRVFAPDRSAQRSA